MQGRRWGLGGTSIDDNAEARRLGDVGQAEADECSAEEARDGGGDEYRHVHHRGPWAGEVRTLEAVCPAAQMISLVAQYRSTCSLSLSVMLVSTVSTFVSPQVVLPSPCACSGEKRGSLFACRCHFARAVTRLLALDLFEKKIPKKRVTPGSLATGE